jgi:FtsP/CotA-like multicopper oxidase with cupredoxin domain
VIAWLGCTAALQPPAERRLPEIEPALDVDPDPGRVEVHLEAIVTELSWGGGPATEAWAYRDAYGGSTSIPGPLLQVEEGDELEVHLHNALPMSSTLHLHGVALPNDMDGSEITQMVVRPGEDHHHTFVVTHPGTFWYHPHFEVADQMARGLYGPGLSRGDTDLHETADRTLVLVDALVDDEGLPVYDVEPELWRVGRQGDLVLINGAPAGEDLVLRATPRERWRIVNAAHSRYFGLSLEDHELRVVGGDAGPVRTPWSTQLLVVAPGDRYELIVQPEPGSRAVLWSLPVDRGFGVPPGEALPLLTVVGPDAQVSLPALPRSRAGMPRVPLSPSTATRVLSLAEGTAPDGEPLFSIDGVPWPFSNPVPVREGEVEVWEVHNCTEGHQPFHLHGLFFDVLDLDGLSPLHDSREDVADIPPGGMLRMAVPYEVPGQWMFHTHLLDLASHGMMAVIDVGDHAPAPSVPLTCAPGGQTAR